MPSCSWEANSSTLLIHLDTSSSWIVALLGLAPSPLLQPFPSPLVTTLCKEGAMSVVVQATPATLLDSLIRRYLKDDLTVREYVPFVLEAITHHRLLHDRHDQAVPDTQSGQKQQSTQHRIWTQRVRALLESQQPGARWAGVCFVRITAQQSISMFQDHVRTWVTLLVGMLTVMSIGSDS